MIKGDKTSGVYSIGFFGPSVLASFSGRDYTEDRRSEFLKDAGVSVDSLVQLKQVHSANLVLIKANQRPSPDFQADGMLTKTPGITLGIRTADCVPVFFWDEERKAAGIAHAGWRGIYQGIIPKMVQAMRQNFGSEAQSIKVAFGPAIRPCCYLVGDEFSEFFPQFFISPQAGETQGKMDLIAAVSFGLSQEGIDEAQVFDTGFCTSCNARDFFSARREKGTLERMLSIIQIRPDVV